MAFHLLFDDCEIEIRGTPEKPLFNMRDVARKLGDLHNFHRRIKYLRPADITYMMANDEIDRPRSAPFVSEIGVYNYIMRLNTDAAREFQYSIYDKMVEWRKEAITTKMMEGRLATGRLDDALREERSLKFGVFQKDADSEPCDWADFYVAKYFLRLRSRIYRESGNKALVFKFIREDVSESTINAINKLAAKHSGRYFDEFEEQVINLLEKERSEHWTSKNIENLTKIPIPQK